MGGKDPSVPVCHVAGGVRLTWRRCQGPQLPTLAENHHLVWRFFFMARYPMYERSVEPQRPRPLEPPLTQMEVYAHKRTLRAFNSCGHCNMSKANNLCVCWASSFALIAHLTDILDLLKQDVCVCLQYEQYVSEADVLSSVLVHLWVILHCGNDSEVTKHEPASHFLCSIFCFRIGLNHSFLRGQRARTVDAIIQTRWLRFMFAFPVLNRI